MRAVIPIVPARAAPPPAAAEAHYVSLFEKAPKIYPRAVSGGFAVWRWALVALTQALYYGLPWLPWNGRQAVLFDLQARRFFIFDLVLYPQDFIYLTALLVVSALGLFLFTAVAGRLWCGYACPQTVYTEIFLWVERRIEGDRIARMRRDAGPASLDKHLRKLAKHAAWLAIAGWTGITFVGYFTPIQTLATGVVQGQLGGWESFWVGFYGIATYGNAGFMREQVCKYMCPYARFQSAMFDRDTLVIAYDAARGDPRGSRPRSADARALGLGSCIDCGLCVQVCPTGIDIRRGLQHECIGCAACIDVCNGVMDKMRYPRGLIRYATENGMAGGWGSRQMLGRVLRPRVLVYSGVLLGVATAFVASLVVRDPFRVDVVRDRGVLARTVGAGDIENVYRLQIMNGTERSHRYAVTAEGLPGLAVHSVAVAELGPAEARWLALRLRLPRAAVEQAGARSNPVRLHIERLADTGQASRTVVEKTTFIVPQAAGEETTHAR